MWRKIYNAIWANKARRAAVLTIIIALIVSGTALAILNTIGKSIQEQLFTNPDSWKEDEIRTDVKNALASWKESIK